MVERRMANRSARSRPFPALPRPGAWRSYGPSELAELARLWLILAAVDLRLALPGERSARAWILGGRGERRARRSEKRTQRGVGAPGPRALAEAERLAALARTAARFRLRSATPCLVLALALRHRLSSMGLEPRLELGSSEAAGDPRRHRRARLAKARRPGHRPPGRGPGLQAAREDRAQSEPLDSLTRPGTPPTSLSSTCGMPRHGRSPGQVREGGVRRHLAAPLRGF